MAYNQSLYIFHGPVSIAGIGGYLADYQKRKGHISDHVVWANLGVHQLQDFSLHTDLYPSKFRNRFIRFSWFLMALAKYDIFHFYYGISLLPFGLDLPVLRMLGKKIVMHYVGSDVRLVSLEQERNKYAHLLTIGQDHPRHDTGKKRMMKWHNLWCHKFIAIRNLIASARTVIPDKKLVTQPWVHQVGIDTSECPEEVEISTHTPPLLVHAPSEPNIKGTKYVRKAIKLLEKKGVEFKYKELSGVPNTEAQEIYKNSDIIIDQFLLGGIGTLAFEGMCFGKPVVGYVLQDVIDEHMPDCPVWNANIDNLADRLETLIRDADLRVRLGREGVRFVKKNLDKWG